jgi:hypothetical protein
VITRRSRQARRLAAHCARCIAIERHAGGWVHQNLRHTFQVKTDIQGVASPAKFVVDTGELLAVNKLKLFVIAGNQGGRTQIFRSNCKFLQKKILFNDRLPVVPAACSIC